MKKYTGMCHILMGFLGAVGLAFAIFVTTKYSKGAYEERYYRLTQCNVTYSDINISSDTIDGTNSDKYSVFFDVIYTVDGNLEQTRIIQQEITQESALQLLDKYEKGYQYDCYYDEFAVYSVIWTKIDITQIFVAMIILWILGSFLCCVAIAIHVFFYQDFTDINK